MVARIVCVAVCCLVLASVASAQRGITYATCSASGDPHYTTFDGVYHDFQGEGNFVIVKGLQVEAHIQTLRCGGSAAKPVTCIRSVTIAVNDPELPGLNATVKYGMWGGVPDSLIISDGAAGPQTYTATGATALPKAGVTISGGRYIVTRSGNTVTVNPTVDVNSGYKRILAAFTVSQYYFVSTVPSIWQGTVNGLCGFYDGSAANEFMDPVDTTRNYYSTPTVKGQRYNAPQTYTWGALWNVSATGFAPLMNHFHAQHSPFEVQDVPTPPSIPDSTQQATINTLAFDDITAIANIEQNCRDAHGDNRANFDNCMYDTAAAPLEAAIATSILSASVAEASLTGSDNPSSSSGSDKTDLAVGLGVGFACLAVVSILVAFFLYHRLRTVKAQYDKALIIVQQQGGAGPTDSGEIRLSENI